jgi:hypothetical protein
MVRVAWQSETDVSSSLIPINPSSDLSPSESVELLFNTWELTAVTLPGYLVCLVFPSSAYLIVSFYRLFLGTLYPAYSSYKAIRNKDVDEYVITFAFFFIYYLLFKFLLAQCSEKQIIFLTGQMDDVLGGFCIIHDCRNDHGRFLGFLVSFCCCFSFQIKSSINSIRALNRFPFYYEIKIIVVLWLLSPATEGSSILYRKFVHPVLVKREKVYFQTCPSHGRGEGRILFTQPFLFVWLQK